jgi:uncharacterized protein (DUF433 family)
MTMSTPAFTDQDLRELPAYTVTEAAGYLRLPSSTLRAWALGQQNFRPVIEIADPRGPKLSFLNLVEAFVLSGVRRDHNIPLSKVRQAVEYLRHTFGTRRPLAEERFETDGMNLFVERFGALIGASQQGQLQLREVIRDRLQRVLRDPQGIPEKIILFPAPAAANKGDVVIDPRLSFGRPVLDGSGVRTSILAERFMAGEDIGDLARDYGVAPQTIQNAIRCEQRIAA